VALHHLVQDEYTRVAQSIAPAFLLPEYQDVINGLENGVVFHLRSNAKKG
jgi:hypothetical protein